MKFKNPSLLEMFASPNLSLPSDRLQLIREQVLDMTYVKLIHECKKHGYQMEQDDNGNDLIPDEGILQEFLIDELYWE